MDILVGGFAKTSLEAMPDAELDQFEALMHVPDQQFYAILRGEREVPEQIDCPVLRRMIDYTANHQDLLK